VEKGIMNMELVEIEYADEWHGAGRSGGRSGLGFGGVRV
jgi:hypothetical protein